MQAPDHLERQRALAIEHLVHSVRAAISSSDRLRVDSVVLRMRADESNVHHAIGEVDPDYQAVLVARDIEYHAAVPQDAGTAEVGFDLCR